MPNEPVTAPAVPVGLTTKVGYSTSLVAFAFAVVAYLSGGDHSPETLGTISAGAIGLVSLVATQIGRYVQAHTSIKAQAIIAETSDAAYGGFGEGLAADKPGADGTELP